MKPPVGAPRVRDYLTMLRNSWILIFTAMAVSAGVGYLTWHTAEPVYQSSAKLFVISPGSATTLDAYFGQLTAVSRAATYQQLAHSDQVTTRTIEQAGLAVAPNELAARINVAPTNSALLDVTVTGTDPDETRQVAKSVAANMVDLSRTLSTVDTTDTELVLVDDAGPAQRQGSARQSIIGATALGLALGIVFASAWALLADKLLGRGQVGRVVGEAAERNG
jgi:capsular polysaccharide biosynthesis protein